MSISTATQASLSSRTSRPPEPGPDQALVRVEAAGINFMDAGQRAGSYPAPLPFTPGAEAAGVVTALGRDADAGRVRVGDRVVIPSAPALGAYAAYIAVHPLIERGG